MSVFTKSTSSSFGIPVLESFSDQKHVDLIPFRQTMTDGGSFSLFLAYINVVRQRLGCFRRRRRDRTGIRVRLYGGAFLSLFVTDDDREAVVVGFV